MTDTQPIRVLGVGNVLCTDDGLGPFAIKGLEAVVDELTWLGRPPLPRDPPAEPEIWWERP